MNIITSRPATFLAFSAFAPDDIVCSSIAAQNGNGEVGTVAEFFSGIGLCDLALERQGWRVVFANDIDPTRPRCTVITGRKTTICSWAISTRSMPTRADVRPVHGILSLQRPLHCRPLGGAKRQGIFGFLGAGANPPRHGRPPAPLSDARNVVGFLMSHGGRDFEQALLRLTPWLFR